MRTHLVGNSGGQDGENQGNNQDQSDDDSSDESGTDSLFLFTWGLRTDLFWWIRLFPRLPRFLGGDLIYGAEGEYQSGDSNGMNWEGRNDVDSQRFDR